MKSTYVVSSKVFKEGGGNKLVKLAFILPFKIGVMEVLSARTTLGSNTLDAFSHGNSYRVTSHNTAMDVFTVDSVGRNYAAAYPPPPYTSKGVTNGNGATTLNAPEVPTNGSLFNGQSKIYDPNEENEDSSDELETRNA